MDTHKEQESWNFDLSFRVTIPAVTDPEDETYKRIVNVVLAALRYAISTCSFAPDSVESIVVADPAEMGEVIHTWQDDAGIKRGYTGDLGAEFATAAKTVARTTESGEVKSKIVIMSGLLYEIVDVIEQGLPLEEWEVQKKLALYVPAHELGHGHDNFLRKHVRGDEIDLKEERDLELISKHYAGVLASEFLACFYSSAVVSPEFQKYLIEEWRRQADELIESVINQKFSLSGDAFWFASHNLWFVMVEFAKLVGHRCGNPELPRPVPWGHALKDELVVFEKLEDFLVAKLAPPAAISGNQSHISQSPEFDLDGFVFDNLFPVWKSLCECYGLGFGDEEDDPKDGGDSFEERWRQ